MLVASAEERIKQALEPRTLDPSKNTGTTYVFNGFNTVLSEGAAMSDNFNFYGQTTFINRPVDTVIQDFQNTYSSTPGQGELSQLLRLVLSSKNLPDDAKEEAATTIHEVAGDLTDPVSLQYIGANRLIASDGFAKSGAEFSRGMFRIRQQDRISRAHRF